MKTMEDSLAMNDTVIMQFADSLMFEPIGILEHINTLIAQDSLRQAKLLNDSLESDNYMIQYEQLANTYLIRYFQGGTIDSVGIDELAQIAVLCPYTDGESVYIARALLSINFPDSIFISYCEEGLTFDNRSVIVDDFIENEEKQTKFQIYPNPTGKEFFILSNSNENIENAMIKIMDINGKLVLQQNTTIPCQKGINVSSLSTGIFIVSILTLDTHKVHYFKLIKTID